MRNKVGFFTLVIFAALLCACKSDNTSTSESEIPGTVFELQAIEESGKKVLGSYGYGLESADDSRELLISHFPHEYSIRFENSGSECNIGFLVFIDGIPQKLMYENDETYIMKAYAEESETQFFSLKQHEATTDKNFSMHRVDFLCMFEPDYRVSENNKQYGVFHSVLPLLPYRASITESYKETEIRDISKHSEVPKETVERYSKENRDGTSTCSLDKIELISEIFDRDNFVESEIDINKTHGLALRLYGFLETTYRISAFINGVPATVFDGEETVDAYVRKGEMTTVNFSIDKEEVQKNKSVLYFILVPIDDPNLIFLPEKTSSYTLVKE